MSYTINEISDVIAGSALLAEPAQRIEHLLIDSRRLVLADTSLFFALATPRRKGTVYISELYRKGVRNFVAPHGFSTADFPGSNFILVNDVLHALHKLASFHRSRFSIPVIGITGSNGKTIVKEWLYQLLSSDFNIVRSPKSYNSQVGVPLSVWQMNSSHTLAIFEAGISQVGEMEKLEEIIHPTIGVFTNVGEAHRENFSSPSILAKEKLKLFKNSSVLIYTKDSVGPFLQNDKDEQPGLSQQKLLSWSKMSDADVKVSAVELDQNETRIAFSIPGKTQHEIVIPFSDQPSIDNAITCLSVMISMGYPAGDIRDRFAQLRPVEMRMQLKQGVNNCTIINDSYSNDFSSLELSLDYLVQQKGVKQTAAIVSEMEQSGMNVQDQLREILLKINSRNIDQAILIGEHFQQLSLQPSYLPSVISTVNCKVTFFSSTREFLQHHTTSHFRNTVVLLKGARHFEFENISSWLEEKTHQTVMEVNLTAIVHNLKQFQQLLKPSTKIMAMVKAFSYGSGSIEIANVLQFHKVDYLAVAYADEGVSLRKGGITMPIMVMSPEASTFNSLIEYNLEPELYSFSILQSFSDYLKQQGLSQVPVHIKVDTGMHRLGFEPADIDKLLNTLNGDTSIVIKSIFSHLIASEDESLDAFTRQQANLFNEVCDKMQRAFSYHFIRHLSNSAAIFRHTFLQLDMVRLGIGLYGVDSSKSTLQLQNVATLKSTIAQVRKVKAGESVGYSRKQILKKDSVIATVRIGYADGFSRQLGNGAGKMFLRGQLATVVGNVCMDMTMIDVTHIDDVQEGDLVEVFGVNLPVAQVALWANTISYEILTGVSERVKRVYFEE